MNYPTYHEPASPDPDEGPSRREVAEAVASITGTPIEKVGEPIEGDYAAFLQGWLVMSVHRSIENGTLPLHGARLEQLTDLDDNYVSHFTVITASGARVKVQFSQEGGD